MISGQADAPAEVGREPIRICLVIDRLAHAGTELQVLLMINKLDHSRVLPYLCLLDGTDATSRALLPSHCVNLRLGVRRLASRRGLAAAWRFWRFLRQERIDVVQTFFPDSTRFACPIARAAGVRVVISSRRNIGHWMTRTDRWLARLYNGIFVDTILANCEAAKRAVTEQEGARPDRVLVVPNIIDLDRFRHVDSWQRKEPGLPGKIGMVGNLQPVKGPDVFIRAAGLVLREAPDTEFVIAGEGDRLFYDSLIHELNLNGKVHLLGKVTDIPGLLATLDVAVLPSRAEGCSNALLEYMAAGRPIVATDVGANAEVLGPMATDCCVPPENPEAMAKAICRMLSNQELAQRVAEGGRHQVSASFGGDAMEHVYEAIMKGRSCREPSCGIS